jgi:transcriptional regulator with XRE-family HTH domain
MGKLDTVDDFALLLADGRARLGIDQAELGRRVGVGQQAVSRWEQRRSRPKRAVAVAVANVLGLPADDVLAAAGYVGAVADSKKEISPAVRPSAPTLPFSELAPDRFEAACVEILQHMYPGGHASRYGGSGERQDGIDVLLDGELQAIAQCKRQKQFGPSDVKTAVRAVANPAAKNYLFLSRPTATAAARAEMALHEAWQLWDGEDLSRYVGTKMAGDDTAVRFVDAYFPNHREPFLGVPQPGPWLTIEEFYAPTSGIKAYTHDWDLVGRHTELAELQAALESNEHGVAIMLGRGGTGKTRLLRSIAELFDAQGWWVRLLPAGSEPDPAAFEQLPHADHVLLIVDDAHDRNDVGNIIARAHSRNRQIRVLIACRPYGERKLDQMLRRAGLLLSDPSLPIVTLGDLTQNETASLAREALGPNHSWLADRLAMLTRDSPLVTTVGGYLIRTGTLDPRELEQDERIRDEILLGFKDALIAESGGGDDRLAVIHAISALQPFRTGNPEFQTAIAQVVGIPYNRIRHQLRSLEDAGVLLRRGDSLRLIPDLLGDVVLADACYDKHAGVDSGYLSEVLAAADGDAIANVFLNVSRVDWQAGHALADTAAPLWNWIQRELARREIATHVKILALLNRVAPFQPERVIATVRWILDNPIEGASSGSVDVPSIFEWRWRHVLDEIPAILRGTSYKLECFREACDVLWQLAQADRRPTNQYPNHPLRVLSELAEYAPQKPAEYNEAILTLAESWAEQAPRLSPLKVIEGLVATEGSSNTYDPGTQTLSFHPFPVKQLAVQPLRRRAIELALSEIRSGDARRGVAGAQFAALALRYPTGSFSREVSDDERKSWEPDFLETIEALREMLCSVELDPAVCVAILETLHMHRADYGDDRTRDAAEAAIAVLPDSVAFDFALLVHDGWGALVREDGRDYERHQRAISLRLSQASSRALSDMNDPALVLLLEERLDLEMLAFNREAAGHVQLLGALVEQRPSITGAIVDRLFENHESALHTLTPSLVGLLGRSGENQPIEIAHRLLAHPAPAVPIETAIGLATRDRSDCALYEGELDLLHGFASSPDVRVRLAVVEAARALAATDIREASGLVARIRFSDSRNVARQIFMYLDRDMSDLTWAALSREQQSTLLTELTNVTDIEDHWIVEFLSRLAAVDPRCVLGLLRQRIKLAEEMENLRDYHPLPYHWSTPLALRQHPDFLALLSELLSWLSGDSSWERTYFGRSLFAAAAGSFDEPVLSLLLEALRAGSEADARTVAKVLEEASNDLVFNHVSVVSELLASAARFGPDTLKAMHTSLYISATSGMRQGTPGEPFPEDVRLRDEGAAIADALPDSTAAARFYRELSTYGAEAVYREIERDRTDHRTW